MESPLAISVNAGTKALGPLLHITGVMLQKHVNPVWGAKDELPVSVLCIDSILSLTVINTWLKRFNVVIYV